MTRLCALPGCDEPMVPRDGELPSRFNARQCCCQEHARKLVGLGFIGRKAEEPDCDEISPRRARAVLSRMPPRFLPMFDQLPRPEQDMALEAWRR